MDTTEEVIEQLTRNGDLGALEYRPSRVDYDNLGTYLDEFQLDAPKRPV